MSLRGVKPWAKIMAVMGLVAMAACHKTETASAVLANPATYTPPDRGFLDTCQGCHGTDGLMAGTPPRPVPRLLGQTPGYLASSLRAYRSGERSDPTMRAMAQDLNDDQINLAAIVLSGEQTLIPKRAPPGPPPGPPGRGSANSPGRPPGPGSAPPGKPLARPPIPIVVQGVCAGCHGRTGEGVVPEYPKIGGQRQDYLRAELADYRSGARSNPIMHTIAQELSPQDIDDVTAYFAAQRSLVPGTSGSNP